MTIPRAAAGGPTARPDVIDIDIPSRGDGSERLRGVMAVPRGDGTWPAVVLVHEAFGVDAVMRRQVQRVAEAGFVAIMPDLFSDGGARRCLTVTFRALSSGSGRAYADIAAARDLVVARDDVSGGVGVLGFCMGGGFALMTASGHGFDAASANYGMLPSDLDAVLAGACPVIGSYGGRDKTLEGAAQRLGAALTRVDVVHDVKEYPAAGHSFLNEKPNGPVLLRPILRRVLGAGPEPESSADAWRRIDAFFHEHLSPSGASHAEARVEQI